MRRLLLGLAALLLWWTPVSAETVRIEGVGTLDANHAGGKITWLTKDEGGDETARSGVMLRVNPTTVIILSPGEDRTFTTDDDVVVHCFNVGLGTQDCEEIETGALLLRRAIRVNNSTAVVLGAGDDEDECEDLNSNNGDQDDKLIILRGLGSRGAKFSTVNDLCFGTPAADPIRINDQTVLFVQPGENKDFHDSSTCEDDADDLVVVVQAVTAAVPRVTVLEVGAKLGVFLTGAPAGLPVRLSNGAAIILSPGKDGEFASAELDGTECGGDSAEDSDDGLVVIGNLSGAPRVTRFVEIGNLAANPHNRPVMVNANAVALLGTGDNQSQQEQECDGDSDTCILSDDEIHVVRNLASGTPVISTFGSGFGFMRRPVALNSTTAFVFEEDQEGLQSLGGQAFEDAVKLNVHQITGIGGSPVLTTIPMTVGDNFHETEWIRMDAGLVMNANQIVFAVHGPPQVLLLTAGKKPILSNAGGEADEWAAVNLTRLSPTNIGYVTAKEGTVGMLKIVRNSLVDKKVTKIGDNNDRCTTYTDPDGEQELFCVNETGTHQPSSQPVRLSDTKFVVATGGASGEFASQGENNNSDYSGVFPFNGDDGLLVVWDANPAPLQRFVTVGNMCGSFACKPLAMGSDSKPIVAILGPGDNGEFDANDDQTDDDDEFISVTGF